MVQNWLRINPPDDIDRVVEEWAAREAPGIALFLACGGIASEADLIPGTSLHDCPEGRRLLER
jgi:hypothetical protein